MITFADPEINLKPKQPKIFNPYVEPLLDLLSKSTRSNPIGQAEIYEKMGLVTDGEKRRARYTISALCANYLIGSSSKKGGGYYWIHNSKEVDESVNELRSRAFSLLERAENIERLWREECHRKLIQVDKPVNIPIPEYMQAIY